MINLTHIVSILNFVFTIVVYAMRWTKLDLTCIYFKIIILNFVFTIVVYVIRWTKLDLTCIYFKKNKSKLDLIYICFKIDSILTLHGYAAQQIQDWGPNLDMHHYKVLSSSTYSILIFMTYPYAKLYLGAKYFVLNVLTLPALRKYQSYSWQIFVCISKYLQHQDVK
jgi:hypothetical protein